jgi:hypothetical protein
LNGGVFTSVLRDMVALQQHDFIPTLVKDAYSTVQAIMSQLSLPPMIVTAPLDVKSILLTAAENRLRLAPFLLFGDSATIPKTPTMGSATNHNPNGPSSMTPSLSNSAFSSGSTESAVAGGPMALPFSRLLGLPRVSEDAEIAVLRKVRSAEHVSQWRDAAINLATTRFSTSGTSSPSSSGTTAPLSSLARLVQVMKVIAALLCAAYPKDGPAPINVSVTPDSIDDALREIVRRLEAENTPSLSLLAQCGAVVELIFHFTYTLQPEGAVAHRSAPATTIHAVAMNSPESVPSSPGGSFSRQGSMSPVSRHDITRVETMKAIFSRWASAHIIDAAAVVGTLQLIRSYYAPGSATGGSFAAFPEHQRVTADPITDDGFDIFTVQHDFMCEVPWAESVGIVASVL